jgi:NTP pyrophosphatase (non-canonical NTP hydrolase)
MTNQNQKLGPFDAELCMMIENVSKLPVSVFFEHSFIQLVWGVETDQPAPQRKTDIDTALINAVRGRLGDRFISSENINGLKFVFFKFDPVQYPEERRFSQTAPVMRPENRFIKKDIEVEAVYFDRNNIEKVKEFTGGGTITIPREINGIAEFVFTSPASGLFVTVREGQYIVRGKGQKITLYSKSEFENEFEQRRVFDPVDSYEQIRDRAKSLFDQKFGNNAYSRFQKLNEEYDELIEAYEQLIKVGPCSEHSKEKKHVEDEMSDLNAVLFHIATIFGHDNKTLLLMALDKVKGRETDPDYKRFKN